MQIGGVRVRIVWDQLESERLMVMCTLTWMPENSAPERESLEFAEHFVAHFSALPLHQIFGRRSRAIYEHFRTFRPPTELFESDAPILPSLTGAKLTANFKVDLVTSLPKSGKKVAIELCFNNREAIGTNLLKLDMALSSRKSTGGEGLAVVVAPTRELLNQGGWDKAYGDASEYWHLLSTGILRYLKADVLLIELHAVG